MSTIPPLLRTNLLDKGERIGIVNYADTVVYTRDKTLVAIRFGGYPEAVQAISDSIFGGCSLELTHPDGRQKITVSSKGKRGYVRKITHDGVYAENVSYLKDDDLQSLTLGDGEDTEQVSANRNIYLFCGNDDELYCELDHSVTEPELATVSPVAFSHRLCIHS